MVNALPLFAEDNSALIKKYSDYYNSSIARYQTDFRKEKLRGCVDYIDNLKKLQSKFQTAGNLDGWEVTSKELTRFRDEPVITEKVSSPSELKDLQDSYSEHLDKLKITKSKQIVALKNKYIAKLEELKLKWTKSGDFKSAFLARDEIKRLNPSDISKSSTSMRNEPPENTIQNSAQTTQIPSNAKKNPQIPTQEIKLRDNSTIHPPGSIPTTLGAVFRRATLSRTELSPWPSDINATMYVSSDKSNKSSRNSFSRTTNSSDKRSIRVSLRTSNSNQIKSNLNLIIQYYTKPSVLSAKPNCIATKNIPIPYLDKRMVFVDLSPVSITSSSTSYSYSSYSAKVHANKFYGCILSIIDSHNNLIYQAVSQRQLSDSAKRLNKNTGNINN